MPCHGCDGRQYSWGCTYATVSKHASTATAKAGQQLLLLLFGKGLADPSAQPVFKPLHEPHLFAQLLDCVAATRRLLAGWRLTRPAPRALGLIVVPANAQAAHRIKRTVSSTTTAPQALQPSVAAGLPSPLQQRMLVSRAARPSQTQCDNTLQYAAASIRPLTSKAAHPSQNTMWPHLAETYMKQQQASHHSPVRVVSHLKHGALGLLDLLGCQLRHLQPHSITSLITRPGGRGVVATHKQVPASKARWMCLCELRTAHVKLLQRRSI
jgi:hypothetical protein